MRESVVQPAPSRHSRSGRPILVVDDDAKIVQLVRAYLEHEGYPVIARSDGRAALTAAREHDPRLIVLDLMLPEIDGIAVTRALRDQADTPILMLSARGTTADRVNGLIEGADDYMPKPFSPAELVVRIKAILRRTERSSYAPEPLRHDDLMIYPDRHEVTRAGAPIALSRAEFGLLVALVRAGGRILSRDALLTALYGEAEAVLDRTVDVYVRRLREKLGDDAESPRYVMTVRGVGYRVSTATS